jgi:hypothetical protein
MKKTTALITLVLISLTTIAQNVQINQNPPINPVNTDEQQFALNNENPPDVQINVGNNPPVQVQQAVINDNPPNLQQSINVNYPVQVQYNQNKPGQSIRVTSYGGGGSSGSSGTKPKIKHKSSLSYDIKKAFDKVGKGHKPARHYGHGKRVKRCAGF